MSVITKEASKGLGMKKSVLVLGSVLAFAVYAQRTEFPEGKDAVFAFTFDDGTVDQYEVAAPVLDKYGIKAIFNIVPERIGREKYMTWEQVADLAKRGHALGNHTLSHLNLNDPKLSEEDVENEIVRGYEEIKRHTGYEAKVVCYPYNASGPRSEKIVKQHGFKSICWRMDNWGAKFDEDAVDKAVAKAVKDKAYRYILMHGVRPGGGWAALADASLFERIVKRLLSHENVWVAGYEESVAYREAYRADRERIKCEAEQLSRYAPHAFKVEVVNAGGWTKERACGEEVEFKVAFRAPSNTNVLSLVKGLKATITLDNFGTEKQFEQEVDFDFTTETRVRGTLMKPGFLRLMVKVPRLNPCFDGPWQRTVPFETEKICVVPNEPEDFDAFWARAVKAAEAIPLDARCVLNEKKSQKDCFTYEVSFATTNGRRVYGYLSIPKSASREARVPLRVQVPGAGMGGWTLWPHPDKGSALLFMTVFPWAPTDDSGDQMKKYNAFRADIVRAEGYHHYFLAGLADGPDKAFYTSVILGINRAIDWVVRNRPEIDLGNVWYEGESQGGAFALWMGALNPSLRHIIAHVPAFSDLRADEAGRQLCTPSNIYMFDDPARAAKARANSGYLDTANFAARIRKPIVFVTGAADWVCPPYSVYGAFHRCPSKKKKLIFTSGHHTSAASEGRRDARRFLQK